MGKFFKKFQEKSKAIGQQVDSRANQYAQKRQSRPQEFRGGKIKDKRPQRMMGDTYEGIGEKEDRFEDDFTDDYRGDFRDDDVGIQPAQKPESFHHFILENQYKDLERSIRGFKDVFDKDQQKWITKRKDEHCFKDEEAEEILRTAQSHLATDIKLSFINKEVFGEMMMAIYKRLDELFYSIAEYRYGRYGDADKQYQMKLQNRKIFLELWTRVQANYSRAIGGSENIATHQGVQGQESLQQTDRYERRDNSGGIRL